MSAAPIVVFYDDNSDFGGHQLMAARGIAAVAATGDIQAKLVFNPQNRRLQEQADAIIQAGGNLELHHAPCITQKLQALRNHFSKNKVAQLARTFDSLNADLVVLLQGEIEDSSLALLGARQSGRKLMSYIPVAHTMKLMGAKLGGLRDQTTRYLFKVPDTWMTISECIASMLKERGATAPIHIVENGIDTERFIPADKETCRREQDLPEGLLLGLCGRIEFKQKQQHFVVSSMSDWAGPLAEAKVLFVGDGPDAANLKELVKQYGLENRVIIRPWEKHPEKLYPALDALLIPSRFEGFPLVMLEAAACGVPIVGADRDGMHDFLPAPWRFIPADAKSMEEAINYALKDEQNFTDRQRNRVLNSYSLPTFESNFIQAIRAELP